ncbi:MAG: hypothetical protein ABFS56_13035 [Pseudomonadota bacterium]
MKKKFVVLSTFLLLGSGCNPSSVVSSVNDAIEKDAILDSFDPEPDKKDIKVQTIKTVNPSSVDDAIEKDAILDSFDFKPDIKEQTIKTVDWHIEKPDDLLSTVEPDETNSRSQK